MRSLAFYNNSKLGKKLNKEDFDPTEIGNFGNGFAVNAIYSNVFFTVKAGNGGAIMVAFGLVMFLSVFFPNFDNAMDDGLSAVALED